MTRRLVTALITGLLALGTPRAASAAPSTEPISFGTFTCAPNWQPLNPGIARFEVTNRSPASATVYLFHSDSGVVAATITHLGPGATRTITVRLSAGAFYSWSCDLAGHPVHISDSQRIPTVRLTGGPGRRPTVPVTPDELVAPLRSYRAYADATLVRLRGQLTSLAGDLASANRPAAEADWLGAHLSWLDLGQDDGAYGAFGDLGQRIDGTAPGPSGGIASPPITGFHRVEHDLWEADDLPAAASDTAALANAVDTITPRLLTADTPATTAGLTSFVTRVHESLEDAMRDTLTDEDDAGSGTAVASLTADVSATREFLAVLAPLLAPRAPYLVGLAQRQLSALDSAAGSARVNGVWTAPENLPQRSREAIDADTGAALETLARIPGILALGGT